MAVLSACEPLRPGAAAPSGTPTRCLSPVVSAPPVRGAWKTKVCSASPAPTASNLSIPCSWLRGGQDTTRAPGTERVGLGVSGGRLLWGAVVSVRNTGETPARVNMFLLWTVSLPVLQVDGFVTSISFHLRDPSVKISNLF
uniref:Uncharacterized protein n=1 Tax=Molossus molossus TaxID=27622 RepID=A0A7J8ES86_MOLMO|nr:hypothetical protein HJG59_008632 [Molossus molossus]